ncbi:disulfide bond formation protein B [Legionella israelensis]|uniref:Disulfide bond formation protein B n=1 Tax=Legionella israelensis TaxID=454 RepID=A0A0W0V335_9GAMM|nr:disulfide bond formation protein B [Legionella israelensis]KTD14246.1 disulfide bond formation protein DsbB [Legionella israelensis]QBR85035.1 disulfide bond formation protein B [Legionella israelensis]QBS10073.1 disulfide bond formation protein B [Legionella israelensis]SCX97463.1 disulfide bond formation protein DsbB [Legionella israelensis DSM 19235]STX59658.1 Disulfide bond formation protein B (Disulfide oxidoreductase) [Legionella israelensis]
MTKRVYRNIEVLLSLITLFVLGASFYFQYYKNMEPCPLCLMQRLCVFLLLFLTFVGVRLGTIKRAKLISLLKMIVSVAGIYFSGRQLWLQSLPPESTPACMPTLDVLFKYFPWQDVIRALFWGAGDCAEVSWQWLGLSMPAWTLLYFIFMLSVSILLYWRLR